MKGQMTNPIIYRNQEEKDRAVRFEIKDTKQQIKITKEYLIRLKKSSMIYFREK